MEIGVIGIGEIGQAVLTQLAQKTIHNLFAYDPDGRIAQGQVQQCTTAAELISRCSMVVFALASARDLVALCNGISGYLKQEQTIIDLTEISPALAHHIANGMRRFGVHYIDCGLVGKAGLTAPFMLFVGGASSAFSQAGPLIRCFAPNCRYMGPSGRGQAVRLLCRDLSYQIQQQVEQTTALAEALGIGRSYFLESLQPFGEITHPLWMLEGEQPVFSQEKLKKDAKLVSQMQQRAFANKTAKQTSKQ